MRNSSKPIVGIIENVSIGMRAVNVPAKIDTGADSSAIWASNIRVGRDGILRFSLFGEGSPYYNGKIFKRENFSVAQVRSSNGKSEIRYRTQFTITLAGKKIRAQFNLSDRSHNTYKILIGRRTISSKFYVDVSKGSQQLPRATKTAKLNTKLRENPRKFHRQYIDKKKGV